MGYSEGVYGSGGGGGAASSLTSGAVDGTTITLTGGNAAQINLGNANNWTAAQTFNASDIILKGAGSGTATFTYANSSTSGVITFPAVTDTVAMLGTVQTFTAAQTVQAGLTVSNSNNLSLSGGSSFVFFDTALSGNNWQFFDTSGTLTFTYPGAGTTIFTVTSSGISSVKQIAIAPTTQTPLLITLTSGPTGAASTFVGGMNINVGTVAFATTAQTGDYVTEIVQAATLTNPSSGTVPNASTIKITGAPIASTNVTITTPRALWVAAGIAYFDGGATVGGSLNLTGSSPAIAKYNNITTAGAGVAFIVASAVANNVATTQTNMINYTPPAAAGRYRLSVAVVNTSGTNTGTYTPSLTYKGADGSSVTFAPNFMQHNSATLLLATTGASARFSSIVDFMIDNSATAITFTMTVSGTAAAYISAILEQLA